MSSAVRALSVSSSRLQMHETFVRPEISLWRRDLISTHLACNDRGILTCTRPHPHRGCAGQFKLLSYEMGDLLMRWSNDPQLVIRLPSKDVMHCEAWRQPDGGLQLVRFDRRGKRCQDFRIFAADVVPFLDFCQRWFAFVRIHAQFVS